MILRRRGFFIALALVTIGVGLVVQASDGALGPIARDVIGDALWAAMMLWWISTVVPSAKLGVRSAAACAVCAGVELSQLIHAPALDAVRGTRLGYLVLGSGFDARDFAAYALGVITAALLEAAVVARIREKR